MNFFHISFNSFWVGVVDENMVVLEFIHILSELLEQVITILRNSFYRKTGMKIKVEIIFIGMLPFQWEGIVFLAIYLTFVLHEYLCQVSRKRTMVKNILIGKIQSSLLHELSGKHRTSICFLITQWITSLIIYICQVNVFHNYYENSSRI